MLKLQSAPSENKLGILSFSCFEGVCNPVLKEGARCALHAVNVIRGTAVPSASVVRGSSGSASVLRISLAWKCRSIVCAQTRGLRIRHGAVGLQHNFLCKSHRRPYTSGEADRSPVNGL